MQLINFLEEDPTLKFESNPETKQQFHLWNWRHSFRYDVNKLKEI